MFYFKHYALHCSIQSADGHEIPFVTRYQSTVVTCGIAYLKTGDALARKRVEEL